jgi:adenosylhomocysteine nucleosidase
MPSEMKPFVRTMSLQVSRLGDLNVYTGAAGDVQIVATTTGMGTKLATDVTERFLAAADVEHVIVMGIAGGVSPDSQIGDVVEPEAAILGPTGAEYRATPLAGETPSGKIHTSDEMLLTEEVLAPWRAKGVVALDMETAAIAGVCDSRCPWSAFRAISDRPSDGMVDDAIFKLAKQDGSPDFGAVARYVLTKPWRIPMLVRVGRDANTATSAAARATAAALRSLS